LSFIKKLLEKNNIFEFIRYIFVGGISALVDMGVLYIMTEFAFDGKKDGIALTLSVATGFVFGLIVNYLLSQLFVFTSKEQREKGKKASAFFIYAVAGLIGFVLTELLMHIGMLFVSHEGLWYILLNCFVKGVVLIWNYVGRKIFVYRGE
jgi:putative flippase GtrA